MIGFIGTSITITTNYNSSQLLSTTRFISSWITSVSSSTVTNHYSHIESWVLSLNLSLIIRTTVSRPVCLGVKHPSGAYDQIFITVRQLRVCWCEALFLSNERTGLSFTIAAGVHQCSHSRVRVPWDPRPYFTVSDSRLPFLSPLQLAGLRWRYSTTPPHGNSWMHSFFYKCHATRIRV
jgi:hypothetical protein